MSNSHRHIVLNAASAVGLGVLLLAAAGSKPNAGSGGDGGAASTSSSTSATSATDGDPTEPKVSVAGKKVPNYEYIRGTCENVKGTGQCDEFYGLIPKFSPDMCKTDGGKFTTSSPKPNPCPKESLIGTCHYPQSRAGEPGQFANYYASNAKSAAELKADCVGSPSGKTEWIDAPVVAAAPASASAQPAAASAAANAKAPAGTAKAAGAAKAPAAPTKDKSKSKAASQ